MRFFLLFELRKKIARIWMRKLDVDELLESC